MKKLFIMVVTAMTAFSGCNSDDAILCEGDSRNEGSTTFTATINGEDAERTTYNSETKKPEWYANPQNTEYSDKINVGGAVYTADASGKETTLSGTGAVKGSDQKYHAYYPATMYNNGAVTLPTTYTYADGKFNMPMYAESASKTLAFKNLCGVLAISVAQSQFLSVNSIVVSSDKRMNGAFTADANGILTFTSAASTSADKQVTLTFKDSRSIAALSTFFVPVPAGTYNQLKITIKNAANSRTMTTKNNSVVTVERSKIYRINFEGKNNLLSGEFSVSATKKVRFTKSNLYWDGGDYRFEANQYDYPTQWNTDHVGHFFWQSTSEVAAGIYPYAQNPSSGTETALDKFFCGEGNKMEVEGISNLYALSKDEWNYLLVSRANAKQFQKTGVTVVGKTKCLVIAPDGYDYTNHPLQDSYTPEAWASAESLGLVCLPAAGCRTQMSINGGGDDGHYWTSTLDVNDCESAYNLYFNSNDAAPATNAFRSNGFLIRLAQ